MRPVPHTPPRADLVQERERDAGPSRRREAARILAGLAAGSLITIVMIGSGWVAEVQATLIEMGFDPDRGQLLAGLLVAAFAAATVRLTAGREGPALGLGLVSFLAVFGGVLAGETHDALKPTGAAGRFDPAGWAMTVGALVVAAIASSWAASVLAGVVRSQLIEAGDALHRAWTQRRVKRADLVRPMALVLMAVTLAATGPVLGDMLNFGPQVRMTDGGSLPVGLFGGGGGGGDGDAVGGPGASNGPRGTSPTQPAGGVTSGSTASARPWEAWRPSGAGRQVSLSFAAPWMGGTSRTAAVAVYLPPGYDQGARHYPVVYEVPWSIRSWSGAIALPLLLDSLIDQGLMPPEIAVFVSQTGGPYPDSECADSFDGREHFESYLVDTVVPFIDATYRTIPTPAARSLLGFSQGGFCTPNLLFHHPDTFLAALSLSGYYSAGIMSPQTINAARPFGNESALIAANSPVLEAARLQPQVRAGLFLVISGDPSEAFYGPQIRTFAAQLQQDAIPFALLPDNHGHAWTAVRDQFPTAMELMAARQVKLGVFG